MSVTITSWVPAYAGGDTVTLFAPNLPGGGFNIGDEFTNVNDILIGTGLNTFTTATMGDILSGVYAPPSGPAGYSYFELRSPVTLINALDVNLNSIINVIDPVLPQDAATKAYVDTAVGGVGGPFLQLAGGTMTGVITFDASQLFPYDNSTSSLTATDVQAAIDEIDGRVDSIEGGSAPYLELAGGTMTGDPIMGAGVQMLLDTGSITAPSLSFNGESSLGIYKSAADEISFVNVNLGIDTLTIKSSGALIVPTGYEALITSDTTLTNKKYVDDAIINDGGSLYLALAGGTMTGDITFSGTQLFPYDNSTSFLTATDMQAAIDEVDGRIDSIETGYLLLTGGTMTGTITFDGAQLFPYNPVTSGMTATDVQAAIDELEARVEVNEGSLAGGPFLQTAGDTMLGGISMSNFRIDSMQDPVNPQDAATMNYVDTEIANEIGIAPYLPIAGGTMGGSIDMSGSPITNMFGPPSLSGDATNKAYVDSEIALAIAALGLIGTGPYLALAGGVMAGDITMGANNITFGGGDLTGLTTLTVSDHILGASDYQSNLGGDAFLIRTAAATTASTPTYSFIGQPTTGMYTSTGDLRLTLGGFDRISINATDIDMINSVLTNVGDPVNPQDAATKNYVDATQSTKVLGSASVDLLSTGSATIYTVPTGKMHIITHIIFKTTSVAGGGTDPDVSIGTQGVSPNNIMPQTTMVLPVGVGADQGYYFFPVDGAVTPSTGTTVRVDVAVAGTTFTALVADVIIVGLEL